MHDKLDLLCLLPPPTHTPWAGEPPQSTQTTISGKSGATVTTKLPLFWYAPDWYKIPIELAGPLAHAVSRWGVQVAALRREIAKPDLESLLHQPLPSEPAVQRQNGPPDHRQDQPSAENRSSFLARIVPYRPERYGLQAEDFDGAAIVDVRLTLARDASGRFAFPPAQVARWEATPADEPLAGGGWVAAAAFPPDVVSIEHLSVKLQQLRTLSPGAAIFVSVNPFRLRQELPGILAAEPDGVILRLDQISLDGLQLAGLTRHARTLMNENAAAEMPLWIVPGAVSADDAVKLIALGASAIAIDSWCNPLRDLLTEQKTSSAAPRPRYPSQTKTNLNELVQLVDQHLDQPISRFIGLYLSLGRSSADARLGSFSAAWTKTLSLPYLD